MKLDYVPLLQTMRDLHRMPLGRARFGEYLRTLTNEDGSDLELTPLLMMNPMGKDHVTALLDALLAMDADGIGKSAAEEASAALADVPGEFKSCLVIADDLKGGWTNRYAYEFNHRNWYSTRESRFWVTGLLWSSETPSAGTVREAVLTAAFRTAYIREHGFAGTLRELLDQEGQVLARAGCTAPALDDEEIAYTREVIRPCLDARDMRTQIECLFGDEAGRTLGFTPRGLSKWAGLALALHDAKGRGPVKRTGLTRTAS